MSAANLLGANSLSAVLAVTLTPVSPVSLCFFWVISNRLMQMLLLTPTLLTFSLVMCVCDITSDGPARRFKALQKCCNTSASAFYFLFLSAILSQPSAPYRPVEHLFLSFSFPFLFFVYKCWAFMMNLSKWMSWRKRNFFRRKLKHPNTEIGKLMQRVPRRDSDYLLLLQPVSEGCSYPRTVHYLVCLFQKQLHLTS